VPYVDAAVLRKQLLDKETGWGKWKMTEAEVDYIVGKLGGHMGDIDLVADALSKRSLDVRSDEQQKATFLHPLVKATVDSIVAASEEALLSVFDSVPSGMDAKVWRSVATSVFDTLSQSGVTRAELAALLESTGKKVSGLTMDNVYAVINALAERNLLRVIAREAVAFHTPRLAAAFLAVKQKAVVQAFLK